MLIFWNRVKDKPEYTEYLQNPNNLSNMKYEVDKEQHDNICQLHTENAASAYIYTTLNVCTGVFLHSFSLFSFDI